MTLPKLQARLAKARAALTKAQAEYREAVRAMPIAPSKRATKKETRMHQIIQNLEALGDMMPSDLAHNIGAHRVTVNRILSEMVTRGMIIKKGFGLYSLPAGHVSEKEAATMGSEFFKQNYSERTTRAKTARKKIPRGEK